MKRCVIAVTVLAVMAAAASAQQDSAGEAARRAIRGRPGGPGWLGMGVQCSRCSIECTKRVACRWIFSEAPGVFSVDADGPADRAGIRTGDTLVSIDGKGLTTAQGGEAFGMVRPGQVLTLRYRRDGRESEARLVAGGRPVEPPDAALAESLRVLAQAQAQRAAQTQRRMAQTRRAMEQQHEAMQRVLEQMQQARKQLSDSTRAADLQRIQALLDSAATRWRATDSALVSVRSAVPSLAPMPAVAPRVAASAMPAMPSVAPMTYAEHREFGPLRYSGRLGNAVIEARSAYAVTTTEVSDSEVVVTSRDLSVRIAIRPRAAPAPRPARAPKPAPAPRPARPNQPPED